MLSDFLGAIVLGAQAAKGIRGVYKQAKGVKRKLTANQAKMQKQRESANRARNKLVQTGKINKIKKNIVKDPELTPNQVNAIKQTAVNRTPAALAGNNDVLKRNRRSEAARLRKVKNQDRMRAQAYNKLAVPQINKRKAEELQKSFVRREYGLNNS